MNSKSFGKKRPTFIQFRELFLETLKERKDGENIDSTTNWLEVGDEKDRAMLLASFKDNLVEKFGMGEDLEIGQQQVNLNGSVESVISQVFHIFSTLSLVEHINENILGEDYKKKYYN